MTTSALLSERGNHADLSRTGFPPIPPAEWRVSRPGYSLLERASSRVIYQPKAHFVVSSYYYGLFIA